jgi:hypothetical protein
VIIFNNYAEKVHYFLCRLCEAETMPKACGLFILLDGTGGISQNVNTSRLCEFIDTVRIFYMSDSTSTADWQDIREAIVRCDWTQQESKPPSQIEYATERFALLALISLIDAALMEKQHDPVKWLQHIVQASQHAASYQQAILRSPMLASAQQMSGYFYYDEDSVSPARFDECGQVLDNRREQCFNAQAVCFQKLSAEVDTGIAIGLAAEKARSKESTFCQRGMLALRKIVCSA